MSAINVRAIIVCLVLSSRGALAGDIQAGKEVIEAQRYKAAVEQFRPLAEAGNVEAEYYMGVIAHDGLGRSANLIEAANWLKKSADGGFDKAQFQYGLMLYEGQGVRKDSSSAKKYFEMAAEHGISSAMHNIGLIDEENKDYENAYKWYELAIRAGADYSKAFQDRLPQVLLDREIAAAKRSADKWQAEHPTAFETNQTVALPHVAKPKQFTPQQQSVTMQNQGGIFVVPVLINNAITLDFVVDSGAADVSIPADVVLTLMRTGSIRTSDFLGSQTYELADGSTVPSATFRIRSLKVGDMIVENVTGSVSSVKGNLLLGQSFLGRFKSWSIDNSTHALVLE